MTQRSQSLQGLRVSNDSQSAVEGQQEEQCQARRSSEPENQTLQVNEHVTEMIDESGRRFRKCERTTMAAIWNMKSNERIYIEFYRKTYLSEIKKLILKSINKKWRDYKSDLKEQIVLNVSKDVLAPQWIVLVDEWFTKENKNAHTSDRKSYARLRKEVIEFFAATHKRKDGTYVNDNIKELMEKARTFIAEQNQIKFVVWSWSNSKNYFSVTSHNVGSRWEATMGGNQLQDIEELKAELHTVNNDNAQLKEVPKILFGFLFQKYTRQLQTQFCNLFQITH
ncbi:hypothetical protein MANES_16G057789v8 [Manihot esculenta]|uniref:Uncharacterized protein n=1 Tax=Manihot esculenta TaxID=3983 RepID=A0ACB7G749_MANES|nr:hypothetical protein MANES_16G057789v8 [Manihot esculenta]